MKRIAIFTPGGVSSGGKRIHVPSLTNIVARLSGKFEISVYSLDSGSERERVAQCGAAVVKYVSAKHDSRSLHKALSLVSAFLVDNSRRRFDLLHGFWGLPSGLLVVLLGKALRIPSLVSLLGGETADLPTIGYGNLARKPTRLLTEWTFRNANSLHVLTKFQNCQLQRLGYNRRNIQVIPIGADESFRNPARDRRPTPPYRFLHVGSLVRVKDQKTLLRAFRQIAQKVQAELRIIGPDYLGGEVQQFVKELGIDHLVSFFGHLPHDRLPDQYRWADVMLHTSLHEAQGVVLAEAAASGVVIAGTNVGLIHDLGNERGISVEPGKDAELASLVVDALQNEKRYFDLASKSAQWASEHTLQWTVQELAAWYLDFLETKG